MLKIPFFIENNLEFDSFDMSLLFQICWNVLNLMLVYFIHGET